MATLSGAGGAQSEANDECEEYEEVKVVHDYYLLSFDASLKRVQPHPEGGQERVPRGSWVAASQEIDPASVVYLRHDFDSGQRSLDPERNPRWKTKRIVDVRAYSKRVPIRVDRVQYKITRVLASRFRQGTKEEGASGAGTGCSSPCRFCVCPVFGWGASFFPFPPQYFFLSPHL